MMRHSQISEMSRSAVLQHQHLQANGLFKSPRPQPKFFPEENTFSQKKYRTLSCTPRDAAVPRPPTKSLPPMSRLFPKSRQDEFRPRQVSFRKTTSAPDNLLLCSPAYDERRCDLYFDQCFQIDRKLGEGSFGEVFKVRSKEDGCFYAVKRSRDRFKGEADKRRKLEEVNKHESMSRHPNCVEFHKAWAERGHLYIQTELCNMSLQQFAEEHHDIPESTVWDFLIDLIQGLKHIHDQNFVHLDIKPANIFCSFYGVCKLGDFGLTVEVNKGDLSEAQEGDPKYLAPELLQGRFGKQADVFSLGITMLELACDLELPQNGSLWHELRKGQIPQDITKHMSESLREIILWMMHPNYLERPTVDQLLVLPRLQSARRIRCCKTAVKKVWSSIAFVFGIVYTLLVRLWLMLIPRSKPSDVMKSPEISKEYRRPSNWDLSFSDDDCFDSDFSNMSNTSSLGCPLANSSCSSEDEVIKSTHSMSVRRSSRKTTKPKTLFSPCHSAFQINPRSSSPISAGRARLTPDGSPNTSGLSDFSHTPTKSRLDTSVHKEEMAEVGCNTLQPRNLMQMFHDIEESF